MGFKPKTQKPNESTLIGPGIGDTDDFNSLKDIGIDPENSIEGTPFLWREALIQRKWNKLAIPTPTQQENIIKQAHALQPIFFMLGGFEITSWLRTPDYNKLIGGAQGSAHLLGLATDFVPDHFSIDEAKAKIKATNIYPGGGEENSTTWIHLDLKHKTWFTA